MTVNELLPLAVIASSLLPGLIIFALPERQVAARTTLNLAGAVTKILLTGLLLIGVVHGETFAVRYTVAPGLELVFKADALALLFVSLSASLPALTMVTKPPPISAPFAVARVQGCFRVSAPALNSWAAAGSTVSPDAAGKAASKPATSAARRKIGEMCIMGTSGTD